MGQGKAGKPVTIDELRETTGSLKTWRTGALARLARKQTERVIWREIRRISEQPTSRIRHGKQR